MKMEHTPHKETLSKCIRPAYHEILEHLWTGLLPQSTTYTYDVSMHLKFLCNQSRNNKLTLPPSHSISQKEKQKEAYFLKWHSLFQYNNKSSREFWVERERFILKCSFHKRCAPLHAGPGSNYCLGSLWAWITGFFLQLSTTNTWICTKNCSDTIWNEEIYKGNILAYRHP